MATHTPVRISARQMASGLFLLGMLPFLAGALLSLSAEWQQRAVISQLAYGVAILSFIGGVHWGAALRKQNRDAHTERFVFSVLPALWAWLCLWLPAQIALPLLATGFGLFRLVERYSFQSDLPRWYRQLRTPVTLVVIASLITSWLAI
jgi:hypothetical protein